MDKNGTLYIGVDVGTGSARAALLNSRGKVLQICIKDIKTWNVKPNYYEQSSVNIWASCVHCIKEITKLVDDKTKIKGIGFDATCSLVVLDKNGEPVSVNPSNSNNNEQNIILWMDHRASEEANIINKTSHDVLKYVGEKVSLEMQMPKILWLKNNLSEESWNNIGYFFDLPDFLTWKATKSTSRSLCSLVCKWNYQCTSSSFQGWNTDFLTQIGLNSLTKNNYKLIGNSVQVPGSPVANGLTKEAAEELGLIAGTSVGTSIIDAHAGGLGMIYCKVGDLCLSSSPERRLALICGTSTCHMASSADPVFASGIWGPYYNVVLPGFWLNEGGQSATGKLINHIIDNHPATAGIVAKLHENMNIHDYLTKLVKTLQCRQNIECYDYLTKGLHIWPDFHGNRSPLADPSLTGMICGLKLSNTEEDLAILYLSTIQALAYGTKHIVETLTLSGYKPFDAITICGGLSKSRLFVQTHANILGVPIICPNESESVLVGAAMLGALASGLKDIENMSGNGSFILATEQTRNYHEKKYKVFKMMLEHQRMYSEVMNDPKQNVMV